MFKYLAAGWKMTLWNPFLILFIFLYQWLWGSVLYRFIQSIVVPVLHRYPGAEQAKELQLLFWAESQFHLMKTNLASPYVWVLVSILLIRMVLTPLIQAGIFDSIHQTHIDGQRSFVKGIRRLAAPFFLLYMLQMTLMLAPLYWIWPKLREQWPYLLHGNIDSTWIMIAVGMLLYIAIIKLLFLYIQLGLTTSTNFLVPLQLMLKHLIPILVLSLSVAGVYFLLAMSGFVLSYVYAGLLTIVLHQIFQLINTLFRLWHISTQHQYFVTKQPSS